MKLTTVIDVRSVEDSGCWSMLRRTLVINIVYTYVFILVCNVTFSGGQYFVTSHDSTCQVAISEGQHVDVICRHVDKSLTSSQAGGGGETCTFRSVVWQRLGPTQQTFNLSDSSKYGLWQTQPGWGLVDGDHVAVLRIRNVQVEDMGSYRCQIYCTSKTQLVTSNHMLNLCLKQGSPTSNWMQCGSSGAGGESRCSRLFWDNVCDTACDEERHVFDGHDCAEEQHVCDPKDDEQCRHRFGDGVCDRQCDTPGCAWDGGDCLDRPLKFADDVIVLTVTRWYQGTGQSPLSRDQSRRVARALSLLLHTVVRIMPPSWLRQQGIDDQQQSASSSDSSSSSSSSSSSASSSQSALVYARLDNTLCRQRCMSSATAAVYYISMALARGWDPGIPITRLAVLQHMGENSNSCQQENSSSIFSQPPQVGGARTADVKDGQGQGQGRGGEEGALSAGEFWAVVAAVAGGVCCAVLLTAIVIVLCRLKGTDSGRSPHLHACDLDKQQHITSPEQVRLRQFAHDGCTQV